MMKNITKLACILGVLSAAGAAGAVSNAMTISGASFNDQFTGANCISRQNNGISNACSSDSNFIYGIPKGLSSAGYSVTYTGRHNTSGLVSTIALFSHSSSGNQLAFVQSSASNSGNWSTTIPLNSTQAPASSRLTTYVGLPANFQGSFFGLSLAY